MPKELQHSHASLQARRQDPEEHTTTYLQYSHTILNETSCTVQRDKLLRAITVEQHNPWLLPRTATSKNGASGQQRTHGGGCTMAKCLTSGTARSFKDSNLCSAVWYLASTSADVSEQSHTNMPTGRAFFVLRTRPTNRTLLCWGGGEHSGEGRKTLALVGQRRMKIFV